MVVEQPTVTASEFQILLDRVNGLEAQIELLVTALEQVMEIIECDIVAEIDEALGDQPDICPAMVEALRGTHLKN